MMVLENVSNAGTTNPKAPFLYIPFYDGHSHMLASMGMIFSPVVTNDRSFSNA